jgi:hypothetical protein
MVTSAVPDGVLVGAWEPTVVAGLGAPTIGPDHRPMVASVLESSPSQERLGRIAAMLREAELAIPAPAVRQRRERRESGVRRLRPAA